MIELGFRFVLLGMSVLAVFGCSVEYSSGTACFNLGDCFSKETCRFDQDGNGECVPTTTTETDQGLVDDMSTLRDGQVSTDALLDMSVAQGDMNLEVLAMDSSLSDASQTDLEIAIPNDGMAMPALPDLVCPLSDDVASARFECTYPDNQEGRDYCQYFVEENTCELFCASIGLFTCSTATDCCWNNVTESSCAVANTAWSCTRPFESLVCRCFETAR